MAGPNVGIRRAVPLVATLACLLGPVIALAPGATASADGCDNLGGTPRSCVQVRGSGTFVDWARGGVGLRARQSTRGHFDVYGHGFNETTQDETLANDSFVAHTKWGQTVNLGREIQAGTKICAAFYERKSDGSYKKHSPACVKIER